MTEKNSSTFLRPWIYIPLLFLLDIRSPAIGPFLLDLSILLIPIGINLTQRYGRRGFWATVIACVPLLTSIMGPWGALGGNPTVFVIAVHAAWLTQNQRWLASGQQFSGSGIRMMLLLLVCSVSAHLVLVQSDVRIALGWWGVPVLYYAFFLLGFRGVAARSLLITAAGLTLVGLIMEAAGRLGWRLSLDSLLGLRTSWTLDQPREYLTILVYYWIGSYLGRLAKEPGQSLERLASPVTVAVVATILYMGDPLWRSVEQATMSAGRFEWDIARLLIPVGSYYMLPGLALFLGVVWRRGVWISVGIVVAYYALSIISTLRFEHPARINLEEVATACAFSILGVRIARDLLSAESLRAIVDRMWARFSLCGQGSPVTDIKIWERQHDEISSTVRRVMLTMLGYALFCILTLSAPDVSLLGVSSEIKLPIANTSVDYSAFLTVGPIILVGLTAYLHIFLQNAQDLGHVEGARPLPFLFNMENRLAIVLSNFMLYWLPVILLFVFAWKALPRPAAGFWLGLAATGMGIVMAYLRWARCPANAETGRPWLAKLALFVFLFLFLAQILAGGSVLNRPLRLNQQKLTSLDLREVDLKWASLQKAKLEGTDLTNADLRKADLSGATFDAGSDLSSADLRGASLKSARLNGANLTNAKLGGADLTDAHIEGASFEFAFLEGVLGLDCTRLKTTKGWAMAYRDKPLACGQGVPLSPEPSRPRYRGDERISNPWLRAQ